MALRRRTLHAPLLSQTPWAGPCARSWTFSGARVSYWHSARVALWQGVRRLGLEPGARVLVPGYCCGVEVAALLDAGLEVDYYRVLPDLTPDLDHLEQLARAPARALFLIHYFGLPQPLEPLVAFARERGLRLIEDAAHGLFARQPDGAALGSEADLAVFSLRKHLPVPDGGLLVLRGGEAGSAVRTRRPELKRTAKTVGYLAAIELEHRWPRLNDDLRRLLRRPNGPRFADVAGAAPADLVAAADPLGKEFDPGAVGTNASWLSRTVYRWAGADEIRERRFRNFSTLQRAAQAAPGLRPLFTRLPDGASPWLFPVVAERAEDLRRFLWCNGVASIGFWRYVHPTIPRHLFPFEEGLRGRVVALPVHQGLSSDEIARIAR
ncbi:MAG: DegT/DnrJ/EryC1/StrS family aminotransferase, partial [Geminicoccaceae bacterium]|nr:DegT/DnrJ/EryC1/StrS family aminotransferase [Geminicoccaceae bacterium]